MNVKKMLVALLAVGILAFPTFAGAEQGKHVNDFVDLPQTDPHYQAVMILVEGGAINGYEDSTFKPYNNISRQHVALILQKQFDLSIPNDLHNVLSVYNDVDADSYYAKEIAAVTDAKIFSGSRGKFNPKSNITREQLATVFNNSFGLYKVDADNVEINLKNVDPSHQSGVQLFANLGLTTELDNYHPTQNLKRAQFASFLDKTLAIPEEDYNESTNQDDWRRMVEEIGPEIESILQSGWIDIDNQSDFSTLETDLRHYATDAYVQNVIKPYYENGMCIHCDSFLFPYRVNTNTTFVVHEENDHTLKIETIEPASDLDPQPGEVLYTFKKENGNWLLDAYEYTNISSPHNIPVGTELMEKKEYHLTGTQEPEVVRIIKRPHSNDFMMADFTVQVFQYSSMTNNWSSIYYRTFDNFSFPYQIIDSTYGGGNFKQEQVAIGQWAGSGGFLSFFVLGSTDQEHVEVTLDQTDKGYHQGGLSFNGDQLLVRKDGKISKVFNWNHHKWVLKK